MSVIEVHPEELLDREQRGELTERERALLTAHLARCAPCRFERQLRADFELEHRRRLPVSDLTDVIAGALRACDLPASSSEPVAAAAAAAGVGGRSKLWRRAAGVLVACSVFGLGIGYAGAQLGIAQSSFTALLERVGVQVSSRPEALPVRPAPSRRAKAAAARAPAVPVRVAPLVVAPEPAAPEPQASAAAKPAVHAPAKRVASVRPSQRLSAAAAAAPARESEAQADHSKEAVLNADTQAHQSESSTSTASLVAVPVETASHLFERANRARHHGARGEAIALYELLRARFPESAEARLSLAVTARLRLDLGETRAALAGFEDYLAGPDRSLHEEAMVGRIRALASLGREREATAAAEALLRAHPRSAFRPEAEALLAEVERD